MTTYTVQRFSSQKDSTAGLFIGPDDEFLGFTLEDEFRPDKVKGETRIPSGGYKLALRTEGGMHPKYAKRFPGLHKGMLWLLDVPGFELVYIHIGNDDDDTEGCILVGHGCSYSNGDHVLLDSVDAYVPIYTRIVGDMVRGDVWVDVY